MCNHIAMDVGEVKHAIIVNIPVLVHINYAFPDF